LRRKLEHRCYLALQQVSQQHHPAIREFQRIVMRVQVVLIDLSKDGCRVIDATRFSSRASRAADNLPLWQMQVRFPEEHKLRRSHLSGAAKLRLPVMKSRVVSLSPTLAGRDLTVCKL
jgi:hypothetical protein